MNPLAPRQSGRRQVAAVSCCSDGLRCGVNKTAALGGLGGAGLAAKTYAVAYSIIFRNHSAAVAATKPLLLSTLRLKSFEETDGATCLLSFQLQTCGATPAAPYGVFPGDTTCDVEDGVTVSNMRFFWTVPPKVDIAVHLVVGHLHVGAVAVRVYTSAPFSASKALLCESLPVYGTSGPDRGFVIGMSFCDFGTQPRLLVAGTVIHAVATYHADARPFAEAAFQQPWQGVMSDINVSACTWQLRTAADQLSAQCTRLRPRNLGS